MPVSDNWSKSSIVFEGGGSRAFAHVGAIRALEENGLLGGLVNFAGTSAGSMFAVMLALGMTSREISVEMDALDLSDMDTKLLPLGVFSLILRHGLANPGRIERSVRRVVSSRLGSERATLGDLHRHSEKTVVIVATRLNTEEPVFFSHATHGSVAVVDAVMASVSIPFLFVPRKIDGDAFVDGGVTDNFPIWIFNEARRGNANLVEGTPCKIDKRNISDDTIGIRLLTPGEENAVGGGTPPRQEIRSIGDVFRAFIGSLFRRIETVNITPSYVRNTIPVHTRDCGWTSADAPTRSRLVHRGYEQTSRWIKSNRTRVQNK